MRRWFRRALVTVPFGWALLAGCADDGPSTGEVERGRAIFSDPSIATSSSNVFSCATCHAVDAASVADRVLPGTPLAGATLRVSFWGGREDDLLTAINRCRAFFMDTPAPWTGAEPEARALYTFLASLPAADTTPVPFTIPEVVAVPVGSHDAARGEGVFARACASCHGALHTGKGRLAPLAPKLPDETLNEHAATYAESERPLVFVEKARHGPFFQYGGVMPPFSVETLSDEDLSNLLAYLGL